MAFAKYRDRETHQRQDSDIIQAIKESLIQDPRIARMKVHPAAEVSSDVGRETACDAADISVGPIRAESNLQHASGPVDKISSYSPSIAPVGPACELNSRQANLQYNGSPGIAVEHHPSVDPKADKTNSDDAKDLKDRFPVGIRIFRIGARSLTIVGMVGLVFALAWYWDSEKSGIVRSLSFASSALRLAQSQVKAVSSIATGSQPATMTNADAGPELRNQLGMMVTAVANMRRIVDQLAAKQDQMARDIAILQASEQNIMQKIAVLSQPVIVRTKPRRKYWTAP
jgi:hypothetical protein